jgi:hypothetical protein
MKLKTKVLGIMKTKTGKVLFYAAILSVIALTFLISTGTMHFSDMIELNRKMIELCPFCMAT